MESSASQLADPLEAELIEAGLSSLKEQFKQKKVRICIHSKTSNKNIKNVTRCRNSKTVKSTETREG